MATDFWIVLKMACWQPATPAQQEAFTKSIGSVHNSRFKKPCEVAWILPGTAKIGMTSAGSDVREAKNSAIKLVRTHAARGAEIVPEDHLEVTVISAEPLK